MQEGLGIYTVELYLKVRLACSEGMTQRQAAKHFNISRDTVSKIMAAAKGARFTPVGMHTEHAALLQSFAYVNRRVEDEKVTTLYLDIGASVTQIVIGHGQKLAFAKSVVFGGRQLDETIAKQLRCEIEQAREERLAMTTLIPSKVKPNQPSAPQASDGDRRGTGQAPGLITADAPVQSHLNLTEPLEILTDELRMCIRYYTATFPERHVDRIIFTGGEAGHRALCQHVARALQLPAQIADPLARVSRTGSEPCIGVDLTRAQPGWSIPIGLALSPTDL